MTSERSKRRDFFALVFKSIYLSITPLCTSRLWTASAEKYWGQILEFLLCPVSPQAPHFGPTGPLSLLRLLLTLDSGEDDETAADAA